MFLRIWRMQMRTARWADLTRFEQEHSLPMFRRQRGCLGVFFGRTTDSLEAVVCTLWNDREAIDGLASSLAYESTVARLMATDLLTGPQTTEVFEVLSAALAELPGVTRFDHGAE